MTWGRGTSLWWRASDGPGGRAPNPGTPGGGGAATPPSWATSRKVWAAKTILDSYGVCTQPHRMDMEYVATSTGAYSQAATDATVASVAGMGQGTWTPFIRGRYVPPNASGNQQARAAARFQAQCRLLGVKVLWTLMQESNNATSTTDAEVTSDIQNMSDNAADITYAVEGINEPNHNRSDTTAPFADPDWASISTQRQATLWRAVKSHRNMSHVIVIGPSLHDGANDDSYRTDGIFTPEYHEDHGGTRHMHQIAALNIDLYLDMFGLHSYPGRGRKPVYKLAGRVESVDNAFGANSPIWVTEHGYTNSIDGPDGHAVATEAAAGKYGPRALFQFVTGHYTDAGTRRLYYTYFELLDNYDPGAKDGVEENFGMVRVDSTSETTAFDPTKRTNKPIYDAMVALFNLMGEDRGTEYTPSDMVFGFRPRDNAVTDLQFTLWQNRVGTVYLSAWREVEVMNITTKADLNPDPVDVEIWDRNGTRIIQVDEFVRHWELTRP